ncbi:MAG: hypothetical protein AM324_009355 [Candidatus Thorarchaeota archaeon SMTZ1-83]|nr:MAG: hypothetical protein AM324_10865 [Candidatus Thorarchaeota archaeon SMTZ1-83]
MVVRLKNATVESIEDTETKRLKVVKLNAKEEGARISLELPEVLCAAMSPRDKVTVIIDTKPITRGESARLYAEGKVFRIRDDDGVEVTSTVGGLRMTLDISSPTAAQRKTFDSDRFLIAII